MSAAGKLVGRDPEGSLDDIGACLAAIRAMSTHNGVIEEEDARAIYSLTCIALVEWRKLDAAPDKIGGHQ